MRMLVAVLALAAVTSASSPDGGLKIVTVQEQSQGPPWTTTEYVTRDKRRTEFRPVYRAQKPPSGAPTYELGPRTATIVRCDLNQQYYVNLDARDYMTAPQTSRGAVFAREALAIRVSPPAPPNASGTMTVEVTTTDTGERKQAFGHTARHVTIVRTSTPSDPSAGKPIAVHIDGWFIDAVTSPDCDATERGNGRYGHLYASGGFVGDAPRVEFKEVGAPERGFPIEVTFRHSQWPSRSMTSRVTELTNGPVDPALFEVPEGFYHSNRWDRVLVMRAWGMWNQVQSEVWHQVNTRMQHLLGWVQ